MGPRLNCAPEEALEAFMCDCYWHKCELCETMLPIHITDFCMGRDEIEVYCGEHIPQTDVVVFESTGLMSLAVDTPENREIYRKIIECREKRDYDALRRLPSLERKTFDPLDESSPWRSLDVNDGPARWRKDLAEFPGGARIGVRSLAEPLYGLFESVCPNVGVEFKCWAVGCPVVERATKTGGA